ncbi:hypothetical protein TI39_contig602g00007 [Zymoseptoria brevis]|uniref:Uncharacterized protein n=1 Tax=Zymoseptoria brevis TaxID=1047168 RepID=A0A0F4GH97_9PEZI|nr:hypothetical protein TI39_contig602g00007 [Zymoseptoria brevis]
MGNPHKPGHHNTNEKPKGSTPTSRPITIMPHMIDPTPSLSNDPVACAIHKGAVIYGMYARSIRTSEGSKDMLAKIDHYVEAVRAAHEKSEAISAADRFGGLFAKISVGEAKDYSDDDATSSP